MEDHWTFKKEVSIGDLVAVCLSIGGVFTAYFTLRADIAVLQEHMVSQDMIKQSIDARLDRFENKLDRLIERNTRMDTK